MTVIIVPWRPQQSRIAAFEATTRWYRENLAGADVRPVDCSDDVFNLSQARNLGVSSVEDPDEVVVIADADTIPQRESLLAAIGGAATSGLVHLPYTEYRWLGASGTAQFSAGAALDDCDFELVRGACSGVYVTTRRTWESHGGQDERFRGWGFEDAAWYTAHATLLGEPPRRHDGRVFALHHAAEPREGEQYDANAALMLRYREASGSVGAMASLVAESAANARLLPGR
jgi:hypothetical protein